jgi:hypothetical protein
MEEQTFFFNLSEPLEFTKNGQFAETLSLEISPPAPQNYEFVMDLAQKVTRAMFDAQRTFAGLSDDESSPQDAEINADAVKMMLLSSSVGMGDYIWSMAKLLVTTCTLDGETRITNAIFDKIGIADKNRLLCEYVVNFIVPLTFVPALREE